MPKLKLDPGELDIDELEDAEYSEGEFASYNGEVPATGTQLLFRITKMWWTYTSGENGNPMLKVLCVAEDNDGELEEFDGLPAWENMSLTAAAKFKWAPFLEHFDLTIRDVVNKTVLEEEDDNQGAPIKKISTFVPGSDDAVFLGVVKKEKYQGKWQAHIAEWLDPDEPEDEPEPPKRSARSKPKAEANGGRTATRGRRQAKPDPDEEPDEDEEQDEKPARTRRTSGRSAKSSSSRRGSRTKSDDDGDDEPPF